ISPVCLRRCLKTELAQTGAQCRNYYRSYIGSNRHPGLSYSLNMKPNTHIKIQTEEKQKQRAADTCSHCEPEVSVVTDETPSHSTPMAQPEWKEHWNLLLALLILAVMMVLNLGFNIIPEKIIDFSIHAVAYILAGYNVIRLAIRRIRRADFFNEFVLMTVATLGAFYIGSYSEGVAVMVFYCIGEWFQD